VFKGTLTIRYLRIRPRWMEQKMAAKTVSIVVCDAINGYGMDDRSCECFSQSDHNSCFCGFADSIDWSKRPNGCPSKIRVCTKKDAFCCAVRSDVDRRVAAMLEKLEEL